MNADFLMGQSTAGMEEIFPGYFLHADVVAPYRELAARAADAGIDLRLASGYRSFDQQLAIWNSKVSGERPVYNDRGGRVDLSTLIDIDQVRAILRYSALPGASRHHWGTDVDVWDAATVPAGYQLQLTAGEYAEGGVFTRLNRWLADELASTRSVFYRPYGEDRGGVAPEPWHLSFRPLAAECERCMSLDLLRKTLLATDFALKAVVLEHLEALYVRFVGKAIEPPI